MIPPVFIILNASVPVKALLGSNPLRVFPFGEAPEDVGRSYATYSVFNGIPENYLNQVPDVDNLGTQIDIWAETVASCNACYLAIRDALEPYAHMTGFAGSEPDKETKLYHARMDFDFFKER